MYAKTSLYGETQIDQNGLQLLTYRSMPQIASDVLYVIKPQYNYRPDLFASDLYNDPNLWWVFKSRNPEVLEDPIFDFVAGVTIKVPTLDVIKSVVGG